jgi:arylsulfatase A-like enzyme
MLLACTQAPTPPAVDAVWRASFDRLDTNDDGRLRAGEFGAFGPSGGRLAEVDIDGDGGIDFDEWVGLLVSRPPRHQRDLRQAHGTPGRGSAVRPLSAEATAIRTATLRRRVDKTTDPAPANDRPNVLIIGLDTVRASHLSIYGHDQDTTPNLSALATRGVVFENSIANANESLYSHAVIWTARYASEVARPDYETYVIPERAQTMAEVLQAYGYTTGGFVAGGHLDGDFGHDQGFETYEAEVGFGSFWNTVPKFLGWLDVQESAQPWFAFVHSYDAHAPYRTLPPFAHLFADGEPPFPLDRLLRDPMFPERVHERSYYPGRSSFFHHPSGFNILSTETYTSLKTSTEDAPIRISEADVGHLQDHYDGCIAYADMQVGVLLAALHDRGEVENTLIIVLADHGEDLLDHAYVNHRTGLTDSIIRVPTLIAGPGFEAGQRVSGMVQALDFLPTVVRAVGGVVPAHARGQALQDVVSGAATTPEVVYSEGVMNQLSARTETHKLIANGFVLTDPALPERLSKAALTATQFTLYDLAHDAREAINLLDQPTPADRALAERLRAGLVAWQGAIAVGTARQDRSAVDPAVAEQMRKHGYWGE